MAGNHFSEVTENNHAGVIWVITLLGLVYTLLTLITRAFIKWHMLGPDDFALVAAQVFALAQYGAIFSSMHHGLGRTSEMLTFESRSMTSKTAFISQLLLLLSLCLSKCSIIFLIRRVFTRDLKHFWLICNILLAFVGAWGIASVTLISAGCNASNYVPPHGNETCMGFKVRWDIVIALDVVTEVIMTLLPIYFLRTLQMTIDLKARVVIAFAFRLPVAAFAIVFVYHFIHAQKTQNRGVAISTAIAWQQIELSYSLISATIPCLKSFIKSFDTQFGMGDGSSSGPYNYGSSHSQSHSNPNSQINSQYHPKSPPLATPTNETIKMNSLKPRHSASFRREEECQDSKTPKVKHHVGRLRPERLKNSTTICAGEVERPESRGSGSSKAGSQELIIRRDVQFDVRSDYAHAHGS
ncbi:hypothetical protein K469DRAFT_703678 [Zopfia rhizophila CBS 207.26]|uniref:Rhodopsin domain-containing protein n=1 Tax=Zopfia rhizophila CBS 207.26 TaxID=1314779 RepID=A0A6A6E8B8_9PEZI|nr:hypothetical protein K469DRAFT_703678 [Zopfia rhizophila CBS 207.26]